MKKLYIAMLSLSCIQQTQCMELTALPSNNEYGYTIITKDLSDMPPSIPSFREFDALSEKLFAENITDTEIRELVKQGAKLNYQKQGYNGPLPIVYACSKTTQGVKNMATIIELGAPIHNFQDTTHTPLTIAIQNNVTDMIQILIPHENPIVTVYEHTDKDVTRSNSMEKNIREYIIESSFCDQNITSIKSLLDLKLMTANRGLKEFCRIMKPNQKILDLLLIYGADNNGDHLPKIMKQTFPYDQYIEFMLQICATKAFNQETLKRMRTIKQNVDAIVSDLESNESKNIS